MSSTVEASCKWCEQRFMARIADRKRGWAKCCSKPCSASYREFGQSKAYWEARNPGNHTGSKSAVRAWNSFRSEEFGKRQPDDDADDVDISDMDWGASDGGGYESI